jgi:hypothetical protein
MSSKLSLLSRAAAVAGILALALPAVAADTQSKPAQPTATQPSGDVKADKSKVQATGKKPPTHVKHAKHKPMKPVVKTATPAADGKTPAGK